MGLRAQGPAASKTYTLNRVTVTGAKRFTTEQIASASGLRKGQQLDLAGIDAAADRLFQTGAIAKIGYSFRVTGNALDVEFQLTEASQFLPCTYDNFVWFKDADLTAAVQKEVPLFDGALPVGGEMTNQVPAALEHVLLEHKITGKVIATILGSLGGKATGYSLRVMDVPMPVNSIEVVGGPLSQEALAEAEHPLLGVNYSRNVARGSAEHGLTEVYQNEGYLQVKFSEPQVTMKDPQNADASQGVSLKYDVTAGPLYNWNGATWTGIQAMRDLELTQLLGFKPAEIARRDKLQWGLVALREGYGKLGYLDVQISPTPEFDAPQRLVHYQMQVNEGPQYFMGKFTVTGVSEPMASKLKESWKLRPGQVYDASYQKVYFAKDMGEALRGGAPVRGQFLLHQSINRQTHVVDMELQVR